jgi:hypothetical protein
VSADTIMDIALLKFTTEDVLPTIKLLEPHVTAGTHIYSVGCGNTDYPYIADGRVMAYQTFSSTYPTLYTCGPVVYGDSGGGVFSYTTDGYRLIGITVMLAVYNDKSIWTIGLSVPSSHIAVWLRTAGRGSLVD